MSVHAAGKKMGGCDGVGRGGRSGGVDGGSTVVAVIISAVAVLGVPIVVAGVLCWR